MMTSAEPVARYGWCLQHRSRWRVALLKEEDPVLSDTTQPNGAPLVTMSTSSTMLAIYAEMR